MSRPPSQYLYTINSKLLKSISQKYRFPKKWHMFIFIFVFVLISLFVYVFAFVLCVCMGEVCGAGVCRVCLCIGGMFFFSFLFFVLLCFVSVFGFALRLKSFKKHPQGSAD